MRRSLLLVLLTLAGCSNGPEDLLPDAKPAASADATESFGLKQDKADYKVGAAVQAAREANAASKPAVVESELSLASSYLPPVPAIDLIEARSRALAADPAAYAKATEEGKRLNEELHSLWDRMEAEQSKAAADIKELRSQVEGHKAKAEAERKDKIAAQLGLAGAAMLGAGVLLLAFGSYIGVTKFSAALVMVGGAAVVSLPWVFDSNYFPWIAGGGFALAALQVSIAFSLKLWRWAFPAPPPVCEARPPEEDFKTLTRPPE